MAVSKRKSLADAISQNVRPGDTLAISVGHHRWTALARETARQFWKEDPEFTLVMLSLSSLGTIFFRGGLVKKVITGYSGDTFPNFTPNPIFSKAYASGAVEVEHWSFLTFCQRLEAGARGLPAMTTRSLVGSSMAENPDFARVDTPFGTVGMVSALVPDVALLHAPVADRAGNIAFSAPLMDGVWAAMAARRGAVVSVEKIVPDLRAYSELVKIPAHRVLAIVEAPMGAHPGGCAPGPLPVDGYAEDYEFWIKARDASRRETTFDEWINYWVLEPHDHNEYLNRLGHAKVALLKQLVLPGATEREPLLKAPPDLEAPINSWELAAVWGAHYLAERVEAVGADGVLAGAGVANLSAWLGVAQARAAGSSVELTAEVGMWGYEPQVGDPFVLNHKNFPSAQMTGDAGLVLGTLVGGPGTKTIGCLGAAQVDRFGNINSTLIPDGPFLVGSGGGNDVASTATENVVVTTLSPQRTPDECGFVTSPGQRVRAIVTDLGIMEKLSPIGELTLTRVPPHDGGIDAAIQAAKAACGWDLQVAPEVTVLVAPVAREIEALRKWDPRGWFLRPD